MIVRRTFLHTGWQLACEQWLIPPATLGYSRLEWLSARVPGYVHLDLVEHRIVGHPFEELNELGSQWIAEQNWIYRTSFSFAPDPERPWRVLRFEGLDTVCAIHLNDAPIGEHDNMFVPLEIDVTDRLVPGTNELRIEFRSAVVTGNHRRAQYLAKEGLADDVLRFDDRAFVRKAQYMFGWDWGPRLTSPGIGGAVVLLEHRARILDIHLTQ
jgi:beta-mannosidase